MSARYGRVSFDIIPILTIGFIVVVFVGLFAACVYEAFETQESVVVTVVDKERIVTGHGESLSSKHLVFTEGETFQNTDNLLLGKWNSSDIQGNLKPGETYRMTVCGWRVPFVSMYRNIVDAELVRQ